MKLVKSKNHNVNYLTKVVEIKEFRKHNDPEVTKLKCCYIDGYNMITGINSEPGLYLYFPTGSCINPQFLSYANLYRHSELNQNSEEKGMFEDNGRVKAIRLRGELSEGFIIPVEVFNNWIISCVNQEPSVEVNTEFDTVEHDNKSFWVSKKYIPKNVRTPGNPGSRTRGKEPKGYDRLVDGQFRFHYDTVLIKKCPNVISPDDIISITSKWHGTSGISAYVLCKQNPSKWDKIGNWIANHILRINVEIAPQYDYLYSSRTVIKNQYYNKNVTSGYYGCDVWNYANEYLKPYLEKGMTFYYEIVGYLPNGGCIQKGYDYGCVPPTDDKYIEGINFKVMIYRITLTNPDGKVHEFSAKEVQQWCETHNLHAVKELYYGKASELYSDIEQDEHWNENFLNRLANDSSFYMEQRSPDCDNNVPHEGVVIKTEHMRSEAWKLKCFKFIDKEGKDLDKGITNIEDEA